MSAKAGNKTHARNTTIAPDLLEQVEPGAVSRSGKMRASASRSGSKTRVQAKARPGTKTRPASMPESQHAALALAGFAHDKKAENIVILDIRKVSSFADFLVICSGTSEPHLKAISSGIREGMRELHGRKAHTETGSPVSQWVVIDYVDVVAHIFSGDRREFYGLEDLWGDAPRIPFPEPRSQRKPSPRAAAGSPPERSEGGPF